MLPRVEHEATALLETLTLSVGRRTQKRSCFLTLRVGKILRSYGGLRKPARVPTVRWLQVGSSCSGVKSCSARIARRRYCKERTDQRKWRRPTSRCSRRGPASARHPVRLVRAKPRRAATSACGTGRATERQLRWADANHRRREPTTRPSSRRSAPAASNDRTSRSTLTVGSAASIFATLD